MNESASKRNVLRELDAPAGWTALLLEQHLPATGEELPAYRKAVGDLLADLPGTNTASPEEVLLLFECCRPDMEAVTLRENARTWMPEFGVGIWIDQPPPMKWTRDEFKEAAPGTLRPVVERVLRIRKSPVMQKAAWNRLLGSGAAIWLKEAGVDDILEQAAEELRPTIRDISLTSFPFYLPLLRASTLTKPSSASAGQWERIMPGVDLYLRESVEDCGLLVALRQAPQTFRNQWRGMALG